MKRLYVLYIGLLVGAFTACSDGVELREEENITLNVTVGELETSSRAVVGANAFRGSAPTADNLFKADVWFSNTSGEYKNEPQEPTYVPCHTQMTFDGSLVYALHNGKNLKYGTADGDAVYCVGFYPQDAWKTEDGKNVSATIDGAEDLMYAQEINGTWANRLPNQHYEHLLTWLKVCICATSQDAAATWGNVESISVGSANNVQVNLGTNTVTYSGSANFVATENVPLHTTMREVGSIFCSPAKEYTVEVKVGEKTVEKTIKLADLAGSQLTDANQAKGKLFILTLYFNEFDVVDAVCTLNAWDAQNEDLYMNSTQNQ